MKTPLQWRYSFPGTEKAGCRRAGAVPLAALMENKERFKGKRIVLVVSGGNIDFTLIDRIIHKGLASSGRIGVFEVVVDDIPGSLHHISGVIASHRGNILVLSTKGLRRICR